MASWSLTSYIRGSIDIDWLEVPTAVTDKVTEYQNTDPKKIIHYEQKDSADSLKRYYKVGFKDIDTSHEFEALSEVLAALNNRDTFCNNADNKMTFEQDRGLDIEPTIPA